MYYPRCCKVFRPVIYVNVPEQRALFVSVLVSAILHGCDNRQRAVTTIFKSIGAVTPLLIYMRTLYMY